MQRTDDHHHTPFQVAGYVVAAVSIADDAELSADDRAVLLPVILTFIGSKQIFYQQAPTLPQGLLSGSLKSL